jgi:hypothetical protein
VQAKLVDRLTMLYSSSFLLIVAIIISSSDSSAFVWHISAEHHKVTINQHHQTVNMASNDKAEKTEEEEPILQLPEASGDSSIPSIKLGDSIKFDAMGPVIINSDGSTRQIANWDKMTEHEQQVAWRRIAKRNEERRQALLEQQQQQRQEQAMNDKKE